MKVLKRKSLIMVCLLSCAAVLSACTGPQGPPGPPGPPGPAGSGGNVIALRHTHTAANECGPGSITFSIVDHASLNGKPDALVFVTALIGINAARTQTNPNSNLLVVYTGNQTFGTCPAERWLVGGGDITVGAQFDVMVANP